MMNPSRGDSPDQSGQHPAGLSPALLAVLVENHDRFLRFLRRRVRPQDLAEEILHDAIVRGITHGGTLRDEQAVMPWFYRLLRNAIIDHSRSQNAQQRGLSALEREIATRATADNDGDLTETICQCVTRLISVLHADYATALNRVELSGEPLEAFARTSGITRGNAAVRLLRARRALRRAVDRHCGGCAEHGGTQCDCRGPQPRDAASRQAGGSCGAPAV